MVISYDSFLFADIGSSDQLRAVHASHSTILIANAQKSFQVAVGESNRNQLASLTTGNQWDFAYLEGKLWRQTLMC